ncbi:zinc knuckle family protein [Perilla frutescens var. hirtella]|nr:zinc knuckle family protein [Perilla frutescens var. hirtella]
MDTSSGDSTTSHLPGNSPVKNRRKVCDKHNLADIFMSRTDANPFRRFVKCPERVRGCSFFEWVDDPMPDYQTTWVERLKLQKEALEDQVHGRLAVVKDLTERIAVKDREIMLLQGRCAELEALVKKCRRESRLRKGIFAGIVVLLLIVIGFFVVV